MFYGKLLFLLYIYKIAVNLKRYTGTKIYCSTGQTGIVSGTRLTLLVALLSLFTREKNTIYGSTVFSLKKAPNPNLQNNNFSILHIKFTMSYKWAKMD